jgi:hypothetical protein
VKKFSTNLFVAITAFILGLASASALSQIESDVAAKAAMNVMTDSMGNVASNQD